MTTKLYLSIVGLLYLALAVWCTARPEKAAMMVGFELLGGSGRSEFMVVYGGLELALGVIFLLPLVRAELAGPMLGICVLVHGCLVAFRTVSLMRFSGFDPITTKLYLSEWALLASSLAIWYFFHRGSNDD
jgi:hypothetical protein